MLLNSASTDKNRHNELRNPQDSAKGLFMQQKLLLIGVDGVRLDIVRKENHAPNINRILNNGSVVPDVLRKCGRPVVGRGLSALTAWCHRAGTCPGSGAWTIGWR